MLEMLAIDDVIEATQLDLRKALAKKSIRQVAGAARNFVHGLRQRMNTVAAESATQPDSGKDQRGRVGPGSPDECSQGYSCATPAMCGHSRRGSW